MGSISSGKYLVRGRSLRLPNSTSEPSRKATHRNPSHFGSYSMPGTVGSSRASLASMGATGGMTGRSMVPTLPRRRPTGMWISVAPAPGCDPGGGGRIMANPMYELDERMVEMIFDYCRQRLAFDPVSRWTSGGRGSPSTTC